MTNDKPHSEQDDYKELLQEALHQRPDALSNGKQEQVMKIGKKSAYYECFNCIYFLLLIQPILYISTRILCICTYKRNGDTECSKSNIKCNRTKCIFER